MSYPQAKEFLANPDAFAAAAPVAEAAPAAEAAKEEEKEEEKEESDEDMVSTDIDGTFFHYLPSHFRASVCSTSYNCVLCALYHVFYGPYCRFALLC
jgi:hypothetical protein